jgi:predicted DsbA family dithiol-disulfide isomerase
MALRLRRKKLRSRLLPSSASWRGQIYNLKRQRLEALINDKLLAKESAKKDLSVPALLDAEVTSKVGLVTEQEIQNFLRDNRARLKGEESSLREQIRAHLQNQKLAVKREEFLKSLLFRDFPIENLHPGATKAHEAARCANDQGKFWAYHDKLFASPPKSSPEIFKELAKEVGLNVGAFETCFDSGKYQAAIKKDIEEGNRIGVTGTPAFFINGRIISGAQPLEAFTRIIDDELSRDVAAQSGGR